MAHAPEANLQWMVLDGRVEAGEVVHREGAGKWKSSGPVVVWSSTGAVKEQGVGVHNVGAVALKHRKKIKGCDSGIITN